MVFFSFISFYFFCQFCYIANAWNLVFLKVIMTFVKFILRCALKFVFFLQVNLRLFRYLVCWKLFSKCHIFAWLLHVFIWRETTSLHSTFYTKNHTFYSHNLSLFSKCLFSVYWQILSENCKLEIFHTILL